MGSKRSSSAPVSTKQADWRTCYNFAGLGVEDPHYLSMIPMVERMRLRPPVQLFQPPSHLLSVFFRSIARFTVRMLDSQEGQQVASNVAGSRPHLGIQVIRLRGCCVHGGNCSSERWDVLCHTVRVSFQIKLGCVGEKQRTASFLLGPLLWLPSGWEF